MVTAHSAGRFKGAASLAVRLVSVNVNGQSYPIQTRLISVQTTGKGKRTGAMVGGGTGGGALIGGLAGGGKGALIGGLLGAGAGTAGARLDWEQSRCLVSSRNCTRFPPQQKFESGRCGNRSRCTTGSRASSTTIVAA